MSKNNGSFEGERAKTTEVQASQTPASLVHDAWGPRTGSGDVGPSSRTESTNPAQPTTLDLSADIYGGQGGGGHHGQERPKDDSAKSSAMDKPSNDPKADAPKATEGAMNQHSSVKPSDNAAATDPTARIGSSESRTPSKEAAPSVEQKEDRNQRRSN